MKFVMLEHWKPVIIQWWKGLGHPILHLKGMTSVDGWVHMAVDMKPDKAYLVI